MGDRFKRKDEKDGKIPRVMPQRALHGTRVAFQIECDRCGKSDTLPFVPKTAGDVLCHECAEEEFGADWAHGRDRDAPKRHDYECSVCGAASSLPFIPDEIGPLLCPRCYRGEQAAEGGRVGGVVVDRGAGVRRLRRTKNERPGDSDSGSAGS